MSKNTTDVLGDRIKGFERRETDRKAMPGLPLVCRLDGRSFSRFTRGMKRPFDEDFSNLMIEVAKYMVEQTDGCVSYVQSLFRPSTVSFQTNTSTTNVFLVMRQFFNSTTASRSAI